MDGVTDGALTEIIIQDITAPIISLILMVSEITQDRVGLIRLIHKAVSEPIIRTVTALETIAQAPEIIIPECEPIQVITVIPNTEPDQPEPSQEIRIL